MFDLLIHADWSVSAAKRWAAYAARRDGAWIVEGPTPVGATAAFLDGAFAAAASQQVLLGFDFPIGVPRAYGIQTGFQGFQEMLLALGDGAWDGFFEAARVPAEIAITRPFYPLSSTKGVSRAELVAGLGVGSFDDLLRVCERRTGTRPSACALFWTLGGNQVGKAALDGWRHVIRPALHWDTDRRMALWPFGGALADLARTSDLVLAETYPAEAYRMVGAGFLPGESKRRQADRRSKAGAVKAWAERHEIVFTAPASAELVDGFGAVASGEDRFDALLGLLGMIEVVDRRRPERTEPRATVAAWEGWILGLA